VKEFSNAAGFLFDPLDAWKQHYSFKTTLSLIDPGNFLIHGLGPDFESDSAFFHMGIVPLLLLSIGLSSARLSSWRESKAGFWFLILNASWLIGLWFSAGPVGILGGHLDLLKHAQQMWDFGIPFAWLSLAWLGWVAWLTTLQLFRGARIPALIATLLFLAAPIFRIAEHLLPMFRNIRAPESFFSTSGFCCLAAAAALTIRPVFGEIVSPGRRAITAYAALTIILLQLASMWGIYSSRFLTSELFGDYAQACNFLKTAPIQGRVHPLSGRYFYLTLPEQAGRSVDTESSARHFQLKWVRYLEASGNSSGDTIQTAMNIAGVAYILLDKEDPFTPKQAQDFYRSLYPVAFENRYFAVLANPNCLYPAFLAQDFVALPKESYAMAPAALQLVPRNLITVETAQPANGIPGFAGQADGTNRIALLPQYQSQSGHPFARVPLVGNRTDDYQRMVYQLPPSTAGWLVVSEAYHPDWTATIDGKPAETTRAEAALLATYVPQGSHEVEFRFRPPLWYGLCMTLGFLFWVIALAALLFLPSKWAPPAWRAWWMGGSKD
jgi:hypothetical protein